jgi:sigma-B regulation protein RsbU (phosphoserine phosphatase)
MLLSLIATRVAAAIDNARLYWRVERQNRTLKMLASVSQKFSAILDLDELLTKIATTVRGLIDYDAFSILHVDQEQKVLRHHFSIRYDERVNLDNIPLGKGITGAAVTSREVVRVHDTSADSRYIASHPGIRSEVAVPLIAHHRVVGVMDLESQRLGYFTEDHARTLATLAPQIAISVENARLYQEVAVRESRMDEDLRAARELQSVLLPPRAPEIEGLEIAVGLRPAREISGDIYHFFERENNHAILAFGDVSGKGAAAALYGALVTGLLRMPAAGSQRPAQMMKALNEALVERKVEARYVTLLVMLWHNHSRDFTMANAGAIPPMICRNGEIVGVRSEGVPLGLLPAREYEEVRFPAEHGDLIVLYSDGIIDHQNAGGEDYGRGRLKELVKSVCHLPPQGIVDAIFAEMQRFSLSAFDDQTLVVLKVK